MNWLRNFMQGRHGTDQLTFGILVAYLVMLLLGNLTGWYWLGLVSLALLAWALYRVLSRSHEKRTRENQIFLALWGKVLGFFKPVKQWFRGISNWFRQARFRHTDKKTHVYIKCPDCGQQLRLPKGKGKLNARCPKCGKEFQIKT